ncbi:MAG: hypothetical protein IJG13_04455, partial [Kiritimatiellae bacterium]|nr:hypothetical protein [Kiritimatiellia bacterium]
MAKSLPGNALARHFPCDTAVIKAGKAHRAGESSIFKLRLAICYRDFLAYLLASENRLGFYGVGAIAADKVQ